MLQFAHAVVFKLDAIFLRFDCATFVGVDASTFLAFDCVTFMGVDASTFLCFDCVTFVAVDASTFFLFDCATFVGGLTPQPSSSSALTALPLLFHTNTLPCPWLNGRDCNKIAAELAETNTTNNMDQ